MIRTARWLLAGALAAAAAFAPAAPLSPAELTALCANAEDQAHCGRLIEARQLPKFGKIAERDGDELRIWLEPFGMTRFRDTINITGARTYAVWDYLEKLETVVLFTTDADRTGFILVQQRGGEEYPLPSEPVLAPDERHFATADFCEHDCVNEIAVWQIARNGVRKTLVWKPDARWTDVSVSWRGADALKIEYSLPDQPASRITERRLGDPGWKSIPAK